MVLKNGESRSFMTKLLKASDSFCGKFIKVIMESSVPHYYYFILLAADRMTKEVAEYSISRVFLANDFTLPNKANIFNNKSI